MGWEECVNCLNSGIGYRNVACGGWFLVEKVGYILVGFRIENVGGSARGKMRYLEGTRCETRYVYNVIVKMYVS